MPGLGSWLRETRHGRTGLDAMLLLVAGTPGSGWRAGEVWGVHLAWSGDAATWTERLPDGTSVLGASELLGPGEIILTPGEEYTTPWLSAAWSHRVTPVPLAGGPRTVHAQPPPWYAAGRATLSGRALAACGLQMPTLAPEQALLHAAGV